MALERKKKMDDFDIDDLSDLVDLENLDCDWDDSAASNNNIQPTDTEINPDQIRLDREREGRCADCGAQTHEVQVVESGRSIKVPLSVPGEIHRGRCLFCHPLPTSTTRQTSSGSSRQHSYINNNNGNENHRPQAYQQNDNNNHYTSNASVCSHQSSHSIYSQSQHSSAHVRGGPQYCTEDFVENYQQQQLLQQQQMKMQQQQQFQDQVGDDDSVYSQQSHQSIQSQAQQIFFQQQMQQQQLQNQNDDGSVYSQASHQSHHSIHSQASYHSFNQHPSNIGDALNRSGSTNSYCSSTGITNPNDYSAIAAAEGIYQQMKDEPNLDYQTCLQAMRQFPSYAPIQEKGCTIFWAQTANAEVCQALSSLGGVTVILEAMQYHPQHLELQRTGCEALRNLCSYQQNRQVVKQIGGIQILIQMMTNHVNNAEIQRSGCTTLATIAEGSMECKVAVAECGGILAVMKAVEIHPENDVVLRAAYQALRMLGYNPGAKG